MDDVRHLNVAVIGVGSFGARYVDGLQRLAGVDVTWVCDTDPQRCRDVAMQNGVARYSTTTDELCADSAVDGVIVVTPEDAHRDITVDALGAGKHVIVEKPLATKDDDAQAMIAAAERSGKLLLPAMVARHDYRYGLLKQRLAEIEPVRNVYAYRNFDRSLFRTYSRTHSFIENAIHDIDLICWYVQDRVSRVHGFCRNTMGLANPDINWGVLEFENGAIATLQTTWLYPAQDPDRLQWNAGIQVMGEHGVLEIFNDQTGYRANIEGSGILLLDRTGWADIHGEARGAFGAMLRHLVDCLRGRARHIGPTPAEAREAVRIAKALVADAEQRERMQ